MVVLCRLKAYSTAGEHAWRKRNLKKKKKNKVGRVWIKVGQNKMDELGRGTVMSAPWARTTDVDAS